MLTPLGYENAKLSGYKVDGLTVSIGPYIDMFISIINLFALLTTLSG